MHYLLFSFFKILSNILFIIAFFHFSTNWSFLSSSLSFQTLNKVASFFNEINEDLSVILFLLWSRICLRIISFDFTLFFLQFKKDYISCFVLNIDVNDASNKSVFERKLLTDFFENCFATCSGFPSGFVTAFLYSPALHP